MPRLLWPIWLLLPVFLVPWLITSVLQWPLRTLHRYPPATESSILISFSSRGRSAPALPAALDLSAAVATADESAADDLSDLESTAAAAVAAELTTAAIGPTIAAAADSSAVAASERDSDDTLDAEVSSIFDI